MFWTPKCQRKKKKNQVFCVKNQKFGAKKSVNGPKQQQNVRKADNRHVSQSNEVPRKGQPSALPRLAGRGGGVAVKRAGRVSPVRVSAVAQRIRYPPPVKLGGGGEAPARGGGGEGAMEGKPWSGATTHPEWRSRGGCCDGATEWHCP